MLGMDCGIWYASEGTTGGSGVDRGRMLAEMDDEVVRICMPPHAEMMDYSQTPAADLGSGIFWTTPAVEIAPGETAIAKLQWSASEGRLAHYAQLRIYFFLPEAEA
jgi:hypothetical protein